VTGWTRAGVRCMLKDGSETTRADINAAMAARGSRGGPPGRAHPDRVRLNRQHLAELTAAIGELLRVAQDHPDDGVRTTVLWTAIDRQDPPHRASQPAETRTRRTTGDAGKEVTPMATGQD